MSGVRGSVTPPPLVVLDDDPTGTQTLSHAQVVCVASEEAIAAAAAADIRSLHVLTNSRALGSAGARLATLEAARAAAAAAPDSQIVLRGDSTLRAHLLEEYLSYIEALADGAHLPLVLVPALPGAGRVTRQGRQFIVAGREAIPLERTEYARDPELGYSTSRLLDWAEERSNGLFQVKRGTCVPLERLRDTGPVAVVGAISDAASQLPAAVAVDAENEADLRIVADGIRASPDACVRCAPALVGALAGNTAHGLVQPSPAHPGTLVVCGSWIAQAGRQLEELERAYPGTCVEVDAARLVAGSGRSEIDRAAAACRSRLASSGVAVVATPRRFDPAFGTPAHRQLLAQRLAQVVREVGPEAGAVVAKGGITSAVTARVGLETTRVDVVGPVAPGVALWIPLDGPRTGTPFAVVPGNVGDERLIADVVARMAAGRKEGAGFAGSIP